MGKCRPITIAVVGALLGLVLLGLPSGAALQGGSQLQPRPQTQTPGQQPPYGYQAPMLMQRLDERALKAEVEEPLLKLFLEALAEELGISVDRLREAIQAAKDEVIRQRLEEAVRAGRLTYEQARKLRERLSQARPRELAKLLFWQRWREAKARLEALRAKPWEWKQEWKWKREWHRPLPKYPYPYPYPHTLPPPSPYPYYHPYPYPYLGYYNCVCYCTFPPYHFMPPPPQPLPEQPERPKPNQPWERDWKGEEGE